MNSTTIARKKAKGISIAILCVITIIVCFAFFPASVAAATSQSITIRASINEQIPVANFYALPLSGIAPTPLTVTFFDQSTGTGQITYLWNFGDSTTSNLQNPTHIYAAPGIYTVILTVTNYAGISSSLTRTGYITINPPTITLPPTSLPFGVVGTPFSQTITLASGGTPPYTYSVVPPGTLPTGLSLNTATGLISGTPTAAGTFTFTIAATDANRFAGLQTYSITVNQPITIPTATLPAGVVGSAYSSQTITANGGTGSFTYSITSGALPSGLNLISPIPNSFAISGTPIAATVAPSTFTITAIDTSGNGLTGTQTYSITVTAPIITFTPATLPTGIVGSAYTTGTAIAASGGTGPYTYSNTTGILPPGLGLDVATGTISGTPTGAGTYPFTITATDSFGSTGSQSYYITVTAPIITLTPATLPAGSIGSAYTTGTAIAASGGTGPYTYSNTTGILPPGLGLDAATGTISGTPTGAGTYPFTITATDTFGSTGSMAYTIDVTGIPPVAVFTTSVISGTAPLTVLFTEQSTGTEPMTCGWDFTNDGTIESTAESVIYTYNNPGIYTAKLTETNDWGSNSAITTITVIAPPAPIPLKEAVVNTDYKDKIKDPKDGTPPFTYIVTSGYLPTGLTLGTDGTISGSPTVTGTFEFTITATDKNGITESQKYSINVTAKTKESTGTDNGDLGGTGTSGTGTGQATGIAGIAISQDLLAPPEENTVAQTSMGFTGITVTTSPTGERTLDIAPAQTGGVSVIGNTVTISQPGYVLEVVVGGKIEEMDGHIVGYNIESILLITDPVDANITIGNVSAYLEAYLNSLPKGAEIKTSISLPGQTDLMKAFQEALRKEGKELDGWAYNYNVEKTNFDSCGSTNVTMTVTQQWLTESKQTIENVHIIRIADDGSTQVLPIVSIVRDPKTGDYTLTGYSKDGCSVFGLVTAKAAVVEQEQNPNATVPAGVSKPAISTNVGMYGWLMGIVEQNPWIILIVGAVVALAAYFGWWRRRL